MIIADDCCVRMYLSLENSSHILNLLLIAFLFINFLYNTVSLNLFQITDLEINNKIHYISRALLYHFFFTFYSR